MMIRGLVALFFLSHFTIVVAQQGSIRVKVVTGDHDEPVPSATAFLSRTTTGGLTDPNGYVEFSHLPFGIYDLAVSEASHKSYVRSIIIKSEQPPDLIIKILPKTVTADAKRDDQWSRQYARFQKMFLGPDHLKDCKILNPQVLDFRTSQGSFIAIASDPLKIENNYLGYDLEFQIRSCAFRPEKFTITGDVLFKEKTGSDSLKKIWKENRENVYQGSEQHFFRSLLTKTIATEGFQVWSDISTGAGIVRYPNFSANLDQSLVDISLEKGIRSKADGSYSIRMPSRLEIHYKRKAATPTVYRRLNYPVSWMETKNDTLIVGYDGFVRNATNVSVLGTMGDLRVAGWLPSDYESTTTQKFSEAIHHPVEALLEKPYIHTDREYYYPGETMWLKGYMSYSMPMSRDTLSQLVYVELADASGKVAIAKHYLIEDGKFSGDIYFDANIPTGSYQLRSYTAWMLNFDPKLIFTKTINVLGENQVVKVLPDYTPGKDTLTNISLRTDKDSYAAREKITLTIDVFDRFDFRTLSDLSIAVTDLDQAVPLKNGKTITTNYSFINKENVNQSNMKHDIEYGIDLAGQFLMGKKPVKAAITVFQDKSTQNFALVTNDSGRFHESLMFKDTVKFYLKGTSYNNKRGVIKMSDNKSVCTNLPFEPLTLDVYTSESSHKPFRLDDAKVLEEVVVKATKIEKPQPGVFHGQSDYTVTSDWIEERHYTDIFLAIVAKVPGVVYNFDPVNPDMSFPRARNLKGVYPIFFLVDNLPVDITQVAAISVRIVDRIDIIKSAAASIYGSRAAGGVIAIYTKKGMLEEGTKFFDTKEFQEVNVVGYSSASTFKGPDYSSSDKDSHPDYRATIYWSPSVMTDGKNPTAISFYAADLATKYRIVVEGITAAGLPIRAEKLIEVVKAR